MNPGDVKRSRREIRKTQNMSIRERLLKEFGCLICNQVMVSPVTTPCAHNFCKSCLEGAFAGQSFVRVRSRGGRSHRSQKNVMKCPSCPTDIADFVYNIQVNTELKGVIESLTAKAEENGDPVALSEDADEAEEDCEDAASDGDGDDEDKETSVEKLNDLIGESDAQEIQSREIEVTNEEADAGGNGNGKRKRDDATQVSTKRNRKGCNGEDERNEK